jgi:integrase
MATITKRGKGWFVQIRKKGFTPRYQTFTTKADAQAWAREQESKVDLRTAPTGPANALHARLGTLIERYKDEITPAKRSAESELLRLTKMQRHAICDLPVKDLCPAAIAAYRDQRLAEVKAGTVRRELSLLRHLLDTANIEWGIHVGLNPVGQIRLPVVQNSRNRRLNDGEFENLMIALERTRHPDVSAVVRLAIETAMRRGEILALRWSNIELDTRTLYIPHSKTGASRTIPLNDEAIAIFADLKRHDDKVFSITLPAFKSAWNRLRIRAGLADLRFHDLRHEAISRFCEMGLSVPEMALISGHKDPRMLFRYAHLRPTALALKLAGRSWNEEARP